MKPLFESAAAASGTESPGAEGSTGTGRVLLEIVDLRAVAALGPLSVVALIAGWVTTEVGRQPWIVYRVMRTSEAVTGADGVPVGYATLVVVYLTLGGVVFWLLRRLARHPLEHELPPEGSR